MTKEETMTSTTCYHCGETCNGFLHLDEKAFCCEGCKQVYLLLNETGLCNYYDLEKNPGVKVKGKFTDSRFAYLDNDEIIAKLLRFRSDTQAHVQFYLPTMHCASCIWLLENLHRISPAIISSKTNFQRKEIFIVYNLLDTSLRKVVELLAFVGYEPYITLNDSDKKKAKKADRQQIYKIGVAGFCFSNIMMLSFPEYFSSGNIGMDTLRHVFTWLSLALSLPVLLYSASEFFISGWKGLRQRWLNIDAPIALAILIAFGRSLYEIITQTGPGYLDSMSGIVFFMLVGRWFQNRTYDAYSFDRDYTSYFPLGVTILAEGKEQNIALSDLKKGDHILVRNEEMIPADGVLKKGNGRIDYSFVSGETSPVAKKGGELIYAGGKQMGTAIEMEVVTPVSKSYITRLWNNDIFQQAKHKEQSFIHPWSRYFTYALFSIALLTALYWSANDPSRIWPAVTAVLIVACPCSLLLSATFTYGNMLGIYGRHKLYLKNANVIESMGKVDTVVLDKTGTITHHHGTRVVFEGDKLSEEQNNMIRTVTRHSTHPLSRVIAASLNNGGLDTLTPDTYQEISGKGLEAMVENKRVVIGSSTFINEKGMDATEELRDADTTGVHVMIEGRELGRFLFSNDYRQGIDRLSKDLDQDQYPVHVLSGDNDQEIINLQKIFSPATPMRFRQSPQDKLEYVKTLQEKGKRVLMAGDGLNDAGALRQSQVGIAVTDSTNLFSPASDAILDGSQVHLLGKMLHFARDGKKIVTASFVLSILYNIVGLSFATRGVLSPMIAAILMPASSISIVLLVSLLTRIAGRKLNG